MRIRYHYRLFSRKPYWLSPSSSSANRKLSLAICANVLRVLEEEGVPLRDLPLFTGVSKGSIAMAMGILQKKHIVIEPDRNGGRTKVARLTPQRPGGPGRIPPAAQALWKIDGIIASGAVPWSNLREALEPLVGEQTAEQSPLFLGLNPYPDGWRAQVPKPKTLPHYPMVLHRGGFPDGS